MLADRSSRCKQHQIDVVRTKLLCDFGSCPGEQWLRDGDVSYEGEMPVVERANRTFGREFTQSLQWEPSVHVLGNFSRVVTHVRQATLV